MSRVVHFEIHAADPERALDAGATMAVPKMPIKSVGWLAYCKDPEGNIFGMMQNDPSAGSE